MYSGAFSGPSLLEFHRTNLSLVSVLFPRFLNQLTNTIFFETVSASHFQVRYHTAHERVLSLAMRLRLNIRHTQNAARYTSDSASRTMHSWRTVNPSWEFFCETIAGRKWALGGECLFSPQSCVSSVEGLTPAILWTEHNVVLRSTSTRAAFFEKIYISGGFLHACMVELKERERANFVGNLSIFSHLTLKELELQLDNCFPWTIPGSYESQLQLEDHSPGHLCSWRRVNTSCAENLIHYCLHGLILEESQQKLQRIWFITACME